MDLHKGSYCDGVFLFFGRREIRDCSLWEGEPRAKGDCSRDGAPVMGYSPTVSEHSRRSPGLVTGTVDIPNVASNEPGPGSF